MESKSAKLSLGAIFDVFHPRRSVRNFVRFTPNYLFFVLLIIFGVSGGLIVALGTFATWSGFDFAVALGSFFGGFLYFVATIYILGFITWLVGRWLGGKAIGREIKLVLLWSNLAVLIPAVILFGVSYIFSLFFLDVVIQYGHIFFYVDIGTTALFFLWWICLVVLGLSKIQNFSKGRAFFNLVGAFLVIAAGFLVLASLLAFLEIFLIRSGL